MKFDDDDDHMVETLFRNGTITVVGIVLSFSLSFLTQWANNPLPWKAVHMPPVLLISAGIILQIISLGILLKLSSLKKDVYARSNVIFLFGLVITGLGIVSAIVIDALRAAS